MNREVKQYIKESIKIVNSHPFLVVILAFTSIVLLGGMITLFSLLNLTIFIIIMPIIFGRFMEIIRGNQLTTPFNIAKKHWFNFYLVMFLFGIPLLILPLDDSLSSNMVCMFFPPLIRRRKTFTASVAGDVDGDTSSSSDSACQYSH